MLSSSKKSSMSSLSFYCRTDDLTCSLIKSFRKNSPGLAADIMREVFRSKGVSRGYLIIIMSVSARDGMQSWGALDTGDVVVVKILYHIRKKFLVGYVRVKARTCTNGSV